MEAGRGFHFLVVLGMKDLWNEVVLLAGRIRVLAFLVFRCVVVMRVWGIMDLM